MDHVTMLLDENTRATSEEAKHDKIEISVLHWIIEGDTEAIAQFFLSIASASERPPTRPRPGSERRWAWFGATRGLANAPQTFPIARGGQGGHRQTGFPIISGHLRAIPFGRFTGYEERVRWRIEANLSINPTRFVRHQTLPRDLSASEEDWPEPCLFRTRGRPRYRNEIILDGSDNVLPAGGPLRTWTGPANWSRHLARSVRSSVGAIEEILRNAADQAGASLLDEQVSYNLRYVETYWECFVDDALFTTDLLIPPIRSLGSRSSVRSFPAYLDTEQDGLSQSLRVALRAGVEAVVYAKTSKRLRFEIRQRLSELSNTHYHRHELGNLDEVLDLLNTLTETATEEANIVFGEISRFLEHDEASLSVYQLLSEIFHACANEDEFNVLLGTLARHQAITLQANDPMAAAVRRLLDRQVIERVRRRRQTFRVAPAYNSALLTLRGLGRRFPGRLP